jgi:hypothetical protein
MSGDLRALAEKYVTLTEEIDDVRRDMLARLRRADVFLPLRGLRGISPLLICLRCLILGRLATQRGGGKLLNGRDTAAPGASSLRTSKMCNLYSLTKGQAAIRD